jgi:predicted patatin/cPLA2 family phospholipase
MNKLYKISWEGIKYMDEAIADSVAIHNASKAYSPILKLKQNGKI